MDIRTKFVFALVSVALASMLALGVVMYRSVERELRSSTLDQLTGLAEFKEGSVEGIIAGWHDRVSLVASRTQLRASLDVFNRTRDRQARDRIQLILEDAEQAAPLFRRLVVTDIRGDTVAVAESDGLSEADAAPTFRSRGVPVESRGRSTRFAGVSFREVGLPTADFTSELVFGDTVVGQLIAVLGTEELVSLTGNYEGLGDTGETVLVVEDSEGRLRALHPLRDAPPLDASGGRGPDGREAQAGDPSRQLPGYEVSTDGPVGRAVEGEESQLMEGLDYRGELVWAATRFIPDPAWGLVVKLDAAEQARPIDAFRRETVRVAVTLAAFAILAGTLLGLTFAQPILQLSEAAARIRAGDLSARSNVSLEDEVGVLARTFDEMATEMQGQVEALSQFRRFFDVSIDMMCIASTDGYFKLVNGAFVRELGWPMTELLSRPFVSLVHPEDVAPTAAEIRKLATGTPTISFENRFLCLDGTYKRLRWNSYPEEDTGRLFAIARVVTESPEAI